MSLGSIEDVYALQLATLQSTATQLHEWLPRARDAVDDAKLTKAISEHAGRVERRIERLEELAASAPVDIPEAECAPVKAILAQADSMLASEGPAEVRDAALVAELQRISHLEIASYGTVRALADQLDLRDAVDVLGETLAEEVEFDELLTKLATGGLIVSGLNERAQG